MQKHHTKNHIIRNKKGFSLIELLIVIAIILIIAAIAIPNLMRARRAANEASAVASIRTILNCQLLYLSTHGKFTSLSGLAEDGCLDEVLGSGTKSGYKFTSSPGEIESQQFTATAVPVANTGSTATGDRTFFVDENQVIRFAVGSTATSSSSPLGK